MQSHFLDYYSGLRIKLRILSYGISETANLACVRVRKYLKCTHYAMLTHIGQIA